MHNLRVALDYYGIRWEDNSTIVDENRFLERLNFINKYGVECSVIYGRDISYGWKFGLLETMPPVHDDIDDDIEGYLCTADIIEEWV